MCADGSPRLGWLRERLIDTLAVLTDSAQARPLWEEYHRILLEESPCTVLYTCVSSWRIVSAYAVSM